MKSCSYCGRENSDGAVHCRECGTLFRELSAPARPARPRDETRPEWLAGILRSAGMILLIGFLYLLSFGPVMRCCCTKTIMTPPLTTLAVSGAAPAATTSSYTIRYPALVRVIYYPAFLMLSGDGRNSFYGRYMQWWDEPPGQ